MVFIKQVVCYYIISATLIISCLSQGSLDCKNKDSERVLCPSFDAVIHNKPRANWKKLNVINDGNAPLSVIKRGTFNNYHDIDDLQIKNLANGIARRAFDGLNNLHELHLDDNNIKEIVPGAFENLPVVYIYIYNCGVKNIYQKTFDSLPNLKSVFIYGNDIDTIEKNIFTGTWLSHLLLRKNHIRNVEANAFAQMPFLEFLSLEENELAVFEPHISIGFAPKLTYFYINRNKIRKVYTDMFIVMSLLKVLLLNINKIDKIDDNVFEALSQLKLLDISNNELKELSPMVFKAFGKNELHYLFIHNNKLTFLNTEVLSRLPNLNSISIGGNPWQCPCSKHIEYYLKNRNITIICQEEYSNGRRPSCVVSKFYPDQCIYDTDEVEDVIETYDEAVGEYKKLPAVCNIDGFEKPTLGD